MKQPRLIAEQIEKFTDEELSKFTLPQPKRSMIPMSKC